MAVTYPYSVAYLSDKLTIDNVTWDIQRNDQFSGLGTGQFWQAEMAPPLWTATITLAATTTDAGKQIAALIRKLHGAQEAFFLCDPSSLYPQSDPTGSVLGAATVQVNSSPVDRGTISLKGLPAGFALAPGDKIQINSASSRYTFLEVSETVVANGSGVTAAFGVFPARPGWLVVNDAVVLKKPACLMKMLPGSHNPGQTDLVSNTGASFKAIQKVR